MLWKTLASYRKISPYLPLPLPPLSLACISFSPTYIHILKFDCCNKNTFFPHPLHMVVHEQMSGCTGTWIEPRHYGHHPPWLILLIQKTLMQHLMACRSVRLSEKGRNLLLESRSWTPKLRTPRRLWLGTKEDMSNPCKAFRPRDSPSQVSDPYATETMYESSSAYLLWLWWDVAQRRTSLQTLGSIERLQEFYSRKSLKHNK